MSWRTRLLAVAAVAAAAGCSDPDVLLRYQGVDYPVSMLAEQLRDTELPGDPAQRDATVTAALQTVMLQIWAGTQPLDDAERARLEGLWRTRRIAECIDANLKRHFNSAGSLEELARELFEEHRQEFDEPERFLLQMIFLPADDPRTPGLADELLAELRREPDRFGELARAHSSSRTASRDGETGVLLGTAVHPSLRAAVAAHRDADTPFRVDTERGVYILRVLEYLDAVEADFDTVRMAAVRRVQEELGQRLFATVADEIESGHRIEVNRRVFLDPAPDPDAVVYRFDDREFLVSDLFDDPNHLANTTGPVVRDLFVKHQRWLYFSEHFGCGSEAAGDPTDIELAELRLPDLLRRYAAEHMVDRIVTWTDEQGLTRSRAYTLDLYALPFLSRDPYADLVSYRPVIDAIRAGEPPENVVREAPELIVADDLEIDEETLLTYERTLLSGLRLLEEGACSDYLVSRSLGAFLVVCMEDKRGERTIDPDDAEDLEWALDRYMARNGDQVVDALLDDIGDRFRVNRRAIEALEADNVVLDRG